MQGGQNPILQHFYYYDSDEDSPINTTNSLDSALRDFKPFRKVIDLCFKDRTFAFVDTTNKPASDTSGFLPCLATLQNEGIVKEPNSVDHVGEDITDSELLSCWHQVENMISTTPDKRLRLVNSILEDFALSPIREKNEESTKFWEYSPQFILKSKPRITYSSRRRVKQQADCNKRLDFSLNDECVSDSSSISVEENRTQLGEVSTSTVVADTTEMLCENLLNLSAYFTQTCPISNNNPGDALSAYEYPDEGEENNLCDRTSNVVRLVQDINALSVTNYQGQYNSYSSFEDFIGFPESDNIQGSKNETRLQGDKCKISDVTFLCQLSSQSPDKDHENDHVVDKEDEQKDQLDEWNKDYSEMFALVKTPPQSCKSRLRKTVDIVHESKERMNLGFTTPSSKQTLVTEGAKSKAVDILRNLSELNPKQIFKRNILNEKNTQSSTFKHSSLNDFHNLPSTSKAAIRANKEFTKRKTFDGKSDEEPFDEKSTGTPSKQMKYTEKSNSIITGTAATSFSPNKTKIGFQTASGREIKPTNKALKSIAGLFKEFQSEAQQFDETGLEALKNKINLKQSKQPAPDTNDMKDEDGKSDEEPFGEKSIGTPSSKRMRYTAKPNSIITGTAVTTFSPNKAKIGFQTASGRQIKPTNKALKSIAELLKEFHSEVQQFDETGLEVLKNKMNLKQSKQPAPDTNDMKDEDGKSVEEPFGEKSIGTPSSKRMRYTAKPNSIITGTAVTSFSPNKAKIGFQTASGRQIKPTNKALKSIAELLKEFQSEVQQFDETGLEVLKNKINLKQSKQPASTAYDMKVKEPKLVTEDDLTNVIFSEWPLEEELKNFSQNMPSDIEPKRYPDNLALNPACSKSNAATSTSFKGFCTAGGKNVLISEKAQKTAASLLKTLKKDCDTNDLLDIKNKILNKNRKCTAADDQFHEKSNTALALKDSSLFQEDEDSGVKSNRVHLHAFKTNQSNSTNSLTILSVKSPLNESVVKSIIARKNILSLSKRHKRSGRVSPAICGTVNGNTPDKMHSCPKSTSQMATLPSTPNEKTLSFNASNCSTPYSEQRVSCLPEMDDDFKPIPWHDNKSISNAYSNTTFSSPRPSVEDRLGRLKMYGDPPPISPILKNFQNRCRSSGLRPTRSMLKKDESK